MKCINAIISIISIAHLNIAASVGSRIVCKRDYKKPVYRYKVSWKMFLEFLLSRSGCLFGFCIDQPAPKSFSASCPVVFATIL